jgi:SAM-dependent methyltransferase
VAMSTSVVAEHRRGISDWHEKNLSLAPGLAPVANSPFNALLKWNHWNRLIERSLAGRDHFRLSYERLVSEPEASLKELMAFIGEPFDPAMLDYTKAEHDYPDWEWGSADVKMAAGIQRGRVGRARRELSPVQVEVLGTLAGEAPGRQPAPAAELASVAQIEDDRFKYFMECVNGFAGPLGLKTFTNWSKVWEYPWLWFGSLSRIDWPRAHLVDLGSELSPMPWVCALLGARVTLIETNPKFVPIWTNLRDRLRVAVEWHVVDSERIPVADVCADALTSFSVIEHQPDKAAAIAEAARVLKPGGVLALSFDICEPEMGMSFPEWNGRALTLGEFEREIWMHPAFASGQRPAWNTQDIPAFLDWHKQSAPHHTYAVGAAILRKQPV